MKNTFNEKKIGILLLIVSALISYFCSRGKDGQPFLGVTLHTILLIGLLFVSVYSRFGIKIITINALLYFAGSFLGVMIYSELDEMAGMLFIFYPVFALGYLLIASLNLFLMRKWAK